MNFYEAEMRKMFGGNELLTDMKFVGKTMLGKLDDEKLVKLQFVSTGTADKYTAIQASVIDKNDGVLDKQTMKFSEIIGMYNRGNGLDAIEPHMWEYHGKPEWYTPISNPQKAEIAETIYDAVADFFELIGNMGADIFDLNWVQATVKLFTLFGWSLFVAGLVVAIFDVAVEYQNGRANIKTTAINILKGFFACSLIGVVPIELYKFCITLQNTFAHDLAALGGASQTFELGITAKGVLVGSFFAGNLSSQLGLFTLLCLIAFAYCIVKIFFQNIKRGGILLVQMAVGSLYMFSVPRGYTDGFVQWMKQVAAICLTAFMQTTLLYLGLMTFPQNMLLGLGIMLSANEVPRIAQQFGLDSSVKVNMMSVVHATTTAVNLTRTIARAK